MSTSFDRSTVDSSQLLIDPPTVISQLLLDDHPPIAIVTSFNKKLTLELENRQTSFPTNNLILFEINSIKIFNIIPNSHPTHK